METSFSLQPGVHTPHAGGTRRVHYRSVIGLL